MNNRNYWGYRISKHHAAYFDSELKQGRLRQGWGYNEGQNLKNFTVDEGAGRNRPMLRVKKGDILLIPRLPSWGEVAIVEATDDWSTAYRFEIDPKWKDFGHIFPAKYLKKFTRHNDKVTGGLRSTLKNLSRFWNINHYANDVEALLNAEDDLLQAQAYESRLETSVESVFDEVFNETVFSDKLYNKLTEQFTREEWEYALVYGLRELFPFYQIDRVGGVNEANHGADILIKMPGILPDYGYAIAIQVKDYEGYVSGNVVHQIEKSESYWDSENPKLIDKIVIITKAQKENNLSLLENDKNVKFIFATELKQLLSEIGKCFIGMK